MKRVWNCSWSEAHHLILWRGHVLSLTPIFQQRYIKEGISWSPRPFTYYILEYLIDCSACYIFQTHLQTDCRQDANLLIFLQCLVSTQSLLKHWCLQKTLSWVYSVKIGQRFLFSVPGDLCTSSRPIIEPFLNGIRCVQTSNGSQLP